MRTRNHNKKKTSRNRKEKKNSEKRRKRRNMDGITQCMTCFRSHKTTAIALSTGVSDACGGAADDVHTKCVYLCK